MRGGRWGGGGLILGGGFFGEEVAEAGVEVAEGVFIVVGRLAAAAEPAREPAHLGSYAGSSGCNCSGKWSVEGGGGWSG